MKPGPKPKTQRNPGLDALDKTVAESTATPEPQFEEPAKVVTVPDEPDCQNVSDNLTLPELYSNIANEVQMSPVTKMDNVKKFIELHEGFQFPNHTADSDKIRYMEIVAHFKLYEVDQ